MQKIMFDERFGLNSAVMKGTKTMTRRIEVPRKKCYLGNQWSIDNVGEISRYKVGEVVAIAQTYKSILESEYLPTDKENEVIRLVEEDHIGVCNKMYVRADLMPHHIKITGVKLERLQDISDEDCLKEGIFKTPLDRDLPGYGKDAYEFVQPIGKRTIYFGPKEAFASLIGMMCGSDVWIRNPHVMAYTFERID